MSKCFTLEDLPNLRFPWHNRMSLELWRPLKQWIYQRDLGICQYCKKQYPYDKTHCHHVLELSEGGTNHPANLKTLCHNCHKERHPFMKIIIERVEVSE